MPNKVKDFEISVAASLGADPAIITPDLISLPIYSPAALQELNKRYASIDDIPDTDPRRLDADRAIIAATALKLLPYWRGRYRKSSQIPGSKVENFEPDWDSLIANLEAEIENSLYSLSPDDADGAGSVFYPFRITGGDKRYCR